MARNQFKAILKKDLRMAFTPKTLLIIVFVPFIMMFLIIGLPTFFIGSSQTTIMICSDDITYNVPYENTTIPINLGDLSLLAIQDFAENTTNLEIEIVDTRLEALNTSNGIYIPENFTSTIFNNATASLEFRKTYSAASIQGINFDSIVAKIQETVYGVFLGINLEEDIPEFNQVEFEPPVGGPVEGWSKSTIVLASPFAYALFIMVALIGNTGRAIGFGKEKEDGTFETMLTITKNRSHLVLSKLIVGTLSSVLSILAYFGGSALAGLMSRSILGEAAAEAQAGLEGILAIPMSDLLSFKGVALLTGLGIGLVLAMLTLMTVDTVFSKQVAERLGISIVMGFGILFYFTVAFDPTTTAFYAVINPFYWIYHSVLSIIDMSFTWADGLYIGLIALLLAALIFLARRAIEREKVLFT